MATRLLVWKTSPNGIEGTNTVYVDSYVGNDYLNDGTRQMPYRTLTKAWNAQETKPTKIVCRGFFSEQMTTGNHTASIDGDQYGAAIFDGQGKYLMYGFGHSNLIILNAQTTGDAPVHTGSTALLGVGRAYNASSVGNVNYTNYACGLAGSAAFIGKSGLYWGIIGGNTAVKKIVYWKPYNNDTYELSIGTGNTPCMSQCTVYDAGFDTAGNPTKIRKSPLNAHVGQIQTSVFSRVAIVLNNPGEMTYRRCLFDADTKFYYFKGVNSSSGYTEIVPSGGSDDEKAESLISQLEDLYEENNVAEASQYYPTFVGCLFSSQHAAQLFNSPEAGDMTLVPGCDADIEADMEYLGALPPAKNIQILTDSTGVKECWDERSAEGCVKVVDNKIYIDDDSPSYTGGIMTKVLSINPTKVQLNGIFSIVTSKWHKKYAIHSTEDGKSAFGDRYTAASGVLPAGVYMVSVGSIEVNGFQFDEGEAFRVSDDDAFRIEGSGTAVQVVEPNAGEVIYCRCRSAIYAKVRPSDTLQLGATYLNIGNGNITYHGREIVPGESFVCTNETYFTAHGNGNYEIGVLFDADNAPESEWIPARLWGDYYVCKTNGVIMHDDYGVPYSSGNNRTLQLGTQNKSVLDRRYVQFKLMVNKY